MSKKPREATATRKPLMYEEVEKPTSSGLVLVYHAVKMAEA